MSEQVLTGNAEALLKTVTSESIDCVVTSPPYYDLRMYKGAPVYETLDAYMEDMLSVFANLHGCLKPTGALWLNIGDGYSGSGGTGGDFKNGTKADEYNRRYARSNITVAGRVLPRKNLIGTPWRLAFALQAVGWYLRNEIIWFKPNSNSNQAGDRVTYNHEQLFLLSKSETYEFDKNAMNDAFFGRPGLGRKSVWEIPTESAPPGFTCPSFPRALVEPCIRASTQPGGWVLDPFCGSGTVGIVCKQLGRNFVGIEIDQETAEKAQRRIDTYRLRGAV